MFGFLSPVWSTILTIISLVTGVLAVVREVLVMYKPPRADDKKVFWAVVRIALIITAAILLTDEKTRSGSLSKENEDLRVKLTAEQNKPKGAQTIQVNVPPQPAPVVVMGNQKSDTRNAELRAAALQLAMRFRDLWPRLQEDASKLDIEFVNAAKEQRTADAKKFEVARYRRRNQADDDYRRLKLEAMDLRTQIASRLPVSGLPTPGDSEMVFIPMLGQGIVPQPTMNAAATYIEALARLLPEH